MTEMPYTVEETSKVRRTELHPATTLREALLLAERKAPLILTDLVHVRQAERLIVSLRFRHKPRTNEPDGVAAGECAYRWYDDDAELLHARIKGLSVTKPGPRSRASSLAERLHSMRPGLCATVST